MATTNKRLAREQCEKAFASYILYQKAHPPSWYNPTPLTAPVDVGVFIRKGQFNDQGQYELDKPDEIPLPAVCVAGARVKPHEVMGYPVVELHVLVLSGIDEEDCNDRASARVGFISELFDPETHRDDLFAFMNKPGIGNDNRVIKNFNVFGYLQSEEMGQETGRHWIDHLVYDVHCIPTDDTDGDGQD